MNLSAKIKSHVSDEGCLMKWSRYLQGNYSGKGITQRLILQHWLDSETLCDCAGADRKPGMKLKSTESNRSLATRRKEAGLKKGKGKQVSKGQVQRRGRVGEVSGKDRYFVQKEGTDMIGSGGSLE